MFWRGGGRRVTVGKERVRKIYIYGRFKSEEDEDEQLHLFFLYGKKGGEEVDELVNEQNRRNVNSRFPPHTHAQFPPDHPAS